MDFDPRGFDSLKNGGLDGGGDFQEIDGEFLRRTRVSWFTRLLLSIALPWGLGRLAKELHGPELERSKQAHALFAKAERIDIIPAQADLRGFRLVIDNILSLYFVQDGEHFVYDGFEMGLCEDGDVTVFDRL
jgi:hypothetical protein